MTDRPERRPELGPVAELHAQLAADPLTGHDSTDEAAGDADERLIDAAIAHAGLDALSDDARLMLLALTDESESLEPQTRQRLVAAADRGLQRRRHADSPLPLLLFVSRRETGRQLDDLAAALNVRQDDLRDVESGKQPLRALSAELVAAWITQLDISVDQAERALHKSFAAPAKTRRAAGKTAAPISPDDDTFLRTVLDHLRRLTS